MNQIHLFSLISSALLPMINLVLFIFFFMARKALAVDENFTICSVPRYCGRLGIRFPFFIQELQDSRCGYPGFNISCRDNTDPILSLPDADYVIHDIFYKTQSFHVSKAVSWNEDSVCSRPISNISIPEDRFYLPKNQKEIVLLFNCNLTLPSTWILSQYKVACSAENQTNATLALFKDDPMLNNASTYCNKAMVVPVDSQGEGGVESMMNRGVLLNWIASNCSICEDSGGKCGFDYGTYHFKCFCPDRPHAWHCTPGNSNKLKLKLGLGIGCSLALIILISIYAVLRKYKKKYGYFLRGNTSSNPSSKSDPEVCFGLPIFTYSELVEATNNFDHEKELGDGGFGIVYYGKLRDGREVAIKRLYQQNYRRLQQFITEVEILTRLHHKNLVTLYGCTSSHSQELLLVYEFISNGTVADHLHGDRAESGSLTWPIRMSIAIETAAALAYLHASDIIHRDVKTNNILLDDKFSVKVADFGLSRLFPTDVTHISTAPQGTPGYVDPEYHQCYQLTEKSDVYSFGVVLIELISSMPAVDISRHKHEINLANLAISKIQNCAFDELIDPTLGYKSDQEITKMTTTVAELAFRCLQKEKEMRPSMVDVLEELKSIQRGDFRLENAHDQECTGTHTTQRDVPPPSPPNGDQIALLKNNQMPPSPVSVTDKWISCSTTPNTSG